MNPRVAVTYREPRKVEPYAEAVRQAGLEPVLISPDSPRRLDGVQGLLISGGTDVNPVLYGNPPHAHDEPSDDARDALEAGLLREALAADLPIFAICRGMQLFNVLHGGTLIQHLDNFAVHRVPGPDRSLPAHSILVEPQSRLAEIMGAGEHLVNSRHHQAVAKLGDGLRVSARSAPDGLIEAIERGDLKFALAVQWHPEDQVARDAEQRKLFEAFAHACAR